MGRIVTVHQPNYLPWIGFFSKIALADCIILFDTAQYVTLVKRNKIRTPTGSSYLTIPIGDHYSRAKIKDVLLPDDRSWQQKHWKTIHDNYLKSGFFKLHQAFFEQLYQENFQYLWQINEQIIFYLLKCFQIQVEVIKASQLTVDANLEKTDLLILLLKEAGSDVYLSGPSGRHYLELEKFTQNNIELKFFSFQHPEYKQRYLGFEPNLSAIDLLFNVGLQSCEIVKGAGNVEYDYPYPKYDLKDNEIVGSMSK